MSEIKKAEVEQRIEEDQCKIEEVSALVDDPKIAQIIRALQKQITQDYYVLSLLDHVPGA